MAGRCQTGVVPLKCTDMDELQTALAHRDAILDKMLALREYAPMTLKRAALNTFMLNGHQEKATPVGLRRAQAKVLELLEE